MTDTIKLSARLSAVAAYIGIGASLADIGTDHGYIPIYLAQTGRARRIIAVDSSTGSLDKARKNAEKYNAAQNIEFMHASGLTQLAAADIDTAVIAGVGGETIISILQEAPWALRAVIEQNLKIILQPQTKLDVLRAFLYDRGYNVKAETTVTDRGRQYTILVI